MKQVRSVAGRDAQFPPTEEFAKQANAQPSIYAEADADPLAYWRKQADRLSWTNEPLRLSSGIFLCKWFSDGTLNASYNALIVTSSR